MPNAWPFSTTSSLPSTRSHRGENVGRDGACGSTRISLHAPWTCGGMRKSRAAHQHAPVNEGPPWPCDLAMKADHRNGRCPVTPNTSMEDAPYEAFHPQFDSDFVSHAQCNDMRTRLCTRRGSSPIPSALCAHNLIGSRARFIRNPSAWLVDDGWRSRLGSEASSWCPESATTMWSMTRDVSLRPCRTTRQ